VNQLVQELGIQVIAIDGKNLRGSYDRESGSGTHFVSAWATEHRLVLAQSKVQDKSMKLQPSLPYWNCLTLKAVLSPLMPWAPKTIAAQIQRAQADYILCLKANHPTLFQQIDTWFETARAGAPYPYLQNTPKRRHHRTEIRKVWTFSDPLPPLHQAEEWLGLQTIVIVERTRHLWNKTTHEIQFYLSSLPSESPRIAAAIRQHWGKFLALDARCHLVKMPGALSAPS